MSSFRRFQTSITLLVKKYFLMSLLQVGLTSFRQLPRVTHSLTAALHQLRVVVLHIERSWPAIQAASTDRPHA